MSSSGKLTVITRNETKNVMMTFENSAHFGQIDQIDHDLDQIDHDLDRIDHALDQIDHDLYHLDPNLPLLDAVQDL